MSSVNNFEAGFAAGMAFAMRIIERQQKVYGHPRYAVPQPLGSIVERQVCSTLIGKIKNAGQLEDRAAREHYEQNETTDIDRLYAASGLL